jgi:hypothetical protein
MKTYIKNLQAKPEHVRRRILVVGTGVSMVVIVGIWIVSLVLGNGLFFSHKKDISMKKDVAPSPVEIAKELFTKITGSTNPITTKIIPEKTPSTAETVSTDSIPGMPEVYSSNPSKSDQ